MGESEVTRLLIENQDRMIKVTGDFIHFLKGISYLLGEIQRDLNCAK